MIEEDDENQGPTSWWPAMIGGLAFGVLVTLVTMLLLREADYVHKDQAGAHLLGKGYEVLTPSEAAALRARPQSCLASEVCANQIDVNRRIKVRAQSLEATNRGLIRERNRHQAEAARLRERFALEWGYDEDDDDPELTRCTIGGTPVGDWHDCSADQACWNPDLIRSLCALRYMSRLPDLPEAP